MLRMIRLEHALGACALAALSASFVLLRADPAISRKERAQTGAKAVEWDVTAPKPADDEITKELQRWKEHACAECHEAQAKEWASTRHALAWIDERYREE